MLHLEECVAPAELVNPCSGRAEPLGDFGNGFLALEAGENHEGIFGFDRKCQL
jgi:hypothetical protein